MKPQLPNILFIIADHHRWDWIGCSGYGIPVHTPNIDALATRGTLFEQCICQSPLCAPSRASLATGLYPNRTGVPDNEFDLDPSITTYMQLLRNHGYRVATCGKSDLHKKTKWYGLDGWTRLMGQLGYTEAVDQAGKIDAALLSGWPTPSDPYMAYLHQQGLAKIHHDDYSKRREYRQEHGRAAWAAPFDRRHHTDDFAGRAALDLLNGFPKGEPWYLQVNMPGPHDPYDAPAELLARYADIEFAMPVGASPDDRTDHQAIRRNFAAMIEGIDEWVGRFIDVVAMRDEWANTIIVYTSDHGEMLGEHGRWAKLVPQEASIRVPLIIAGPSVQEGFRSNALVELTDLSATFTDLVGLEVPSEWDAKSLKPLLTNEDIQHRDVQISMLHDWHLVRTREWKLVLTAGKPTHLYNLADDPYELENQIDVKDIQSLSAKMTDLLITQVGSK